MKFLIIAAVLALASAAPPQSFSYNTQAATAYSKPTVVATITKTITKPVAYQIPVATITRASASGFEPPANVQPFQPTYSSRSTPQPYIAILKLERNQIPSGDYSYFYQSENGIQASEKAVIKSVRDEKNEEQHVPNVEGSYSYTGPDGVLYTVSYIADEFGYRATGNHLPVPPAIPEAIQRSLELNAQQPQQQQHQS